MAENNQESRVSLDTLAHTQDDVSNGVDYVNFLGCLEMFNSMPSSLSIKAPIVL